MKGFSGWRFKWPRVGAQLEGHANLVSIKGIGPKAASILLSVIGEVRDFESEDKLASYFGIVPRVSNSNEKVQHGRITKRGSKLGRTTLVQCTLVAKKYSPYLQQFYERIRAKKGGGKAIIATARKFLGIIYRTLKKQLGVCRFPQFCPRRGLNLSPRSRQLIIGGWPMKRAFSTTGSLLLILSLSLPLTAQEKKIKPDPKKPTEAGAKVEAERVLTPTQQQALAVLDSLFDKAKEFNDEQSRLRTQAQIADTFWDYDEDRARRQFEEAFRAINDLKLKKQGNYDPTDSAKSWLRRELLRIISLRDSNLMDKLLNIIPDVSLTADSAFGGSEQATVSISLALTLAQEDPQRAAQLVETSLKGGISPMLLTVLQSIQQQEPEMADRLFLRALSVMQNASLLSTMELTMFASYVFPDVMGARPHRQARAFHRPIQH